MKNLEKEQFKCDQCEKYFTEDQMTSTGGDEIYCQNCYPEKLAEANKHCSLNHKIKTEV